MNPELTPWFPADVKPYRIGFYETKEPDGTQWFNYFNGTDWHYGFSNVHEAYKRAQLMPMDLLSGWRGLANPPKQSKGEK